MGKKGQNGQKQNPEFGSGCSGCQFRYNTESQRFQLDMVSKLKAPGGIGYAYETIGTQAHRVLIRKHLIQKNNVAGIL